LRVAADWRAPVERNVHEARWAQVARAAVPAAVPLKPNQRSTLSETWQCWQAAREVGYACIVSARSGETEDTTIVNPASAGAWGS
jgi:enolase